MSLNLKIPVTDFSGELIDSAMFNGTFDVSIHQFSQAKCITGYWARRVYLSAESSVPTLVGSNAPEILGSILLSKRMEVAAGFNISQVILESRGYFFLFPTDL